MKKLLNLTANQLNQNGYHKNVQTKGKIGALFAFPINHTPMIVYPVMDIHF